MNTKQDVADSAVAAGISWLEERGNTDWWEIIDTELLDINQFDSCILGQIFSGGSRSDATRLWPVPLTEGSCECYSSSLDWEWLAAHGFAAMGSTATTRSRRRGCGRSRPAAIPSARMRRCSR